MTGSAPRILAAGDTALTIVLGDTAGLAASRRVLDLYDRVTAAGLPGVIEAVPALVSLTLHYDPCATSASDLRRALAPMLAGQAPRAAAQDNPDEDIPPEDPPARRRWLIPACYDPVHGPDIEAVASACGLTAWQVTALHACVAYRVLMIGFLPGHPYMGDLPPPLHLPRRDTPRTTVPAGSIAIATSMTVIYPRESPGGWHIIARTPVRLFDPAREEPSLLAPGDEIRFRAIDAAEFATLSSAAAAGRWHLQPEGVPA